MIISLTTPTVKKIITLLKIKGFVTLADGWTFDPSTIETLNLVWAVKYPTSGKVIRTSFVSDTTIQLTEK